MKHVFFMFQYLLVVKKKHITLSDEENYIKKWILSANWKICSLLGFVVRIYEIGKITCGQLWRKVLKILWKKFHFKNEENYAIIMSWAREKGHSISRSSSSRLKALQDLSFKSIFSRKKIYISRADPKVKLLPFRSSHHRSGFITYSEQETE